MRIVIVTPSRDFAASAGARVRYRRLADAAPPGVIVMCPIDDLPREGDAYLFAKTYQAAAPALAYGLAARGKRVALDVFDDYFSGLSPGGAGHGDVRLASYRRWFRDMTRAVHRVTVSTPALFARLAPHLAYPPALIADPAPPLDAARLAATLAARQTAMDPHALHFVFFGIASNPLFAAGLADLAAHAPRLHVPGSRHRLTVLTNLAGAREDALAALAKAPLPVALQEWSPSAEAALLATADVAVLPVGCGPFSTAKSPNRAMTALAAGAQVLSLGAPLYRELDPFLYRRLEALVDDARAGRLRHRPSRAPWLAQHLQQTASATTGAERLAALFAGVEPEARPPHAVVLGAGAHAPLLAASDAILVAAEATPGASIVLSPHLRIDPAAAARMPAGRAEGLARDGLDALGIAAPPPLTGHGVLDLGRMRARLAAASAAAQALLPDHALFVAHEGPLAP